MTMSGTYLYGRCYELAWEGDTSISLSRHSLLYSVTHTEGWLWLSDEIKNVYDRFDPFQ